MRINWEKELSTIDHALEGIASMYGLDSVYNHLFHNDISKKWTSSEIISNIDRILKPLKQKSQKAYDEALDRLSGLNNIPELSQHVKTILSKEKRKLNQNLRTRDKEIQSIDEDINSLKNQAYQVDSLFRESDKSKLDGTVASKLANKIENSAKNIANKYNNLGEEKL